MPVQSFEDAEKTDTGKFKRLFERLLERGIYLPPSPFEVSFVSTSHTKVVLQEVAEALQKASAS